MILLGLNIDHCATVRQARYREAPATVGGAVEPDPVTLALLGERERSVTELESMLAIRQPAVSQQLARLRADELVQTRREGKLVYYSLASDSVREIIRTMIRMYQS